MFRFYWAWVCGIDFRFFFFFFFIPHCLRPVANISVFACVCFVSNVGTTVATDEAIFIHLPWTVVSATVSESRVTLTTLACAWIVIVASIAVSYNTDLTTSQLYDQTVLNGGHLNRKLLKALFIHFFFFVKWTDTHRCQCLKKKETRVREKNKNGNNQMNRKK